MFCRDDFGAVRARWDDFWAGRNGRPLYAITVPKNGAECEPRPPYLMGFDGNYKAVAGMLARWLESCEFYGEAIPVFTVTFGADDFAALCGADLVMSPNGDTTWPVHTLKSLRNAKIAFDRNGKWWERTVEFRNALKQSLGDSILISPSLGAGLDAIVGLYGAENLLTDMVDDPEAVREAVAQVNKAYTDVAEACVELFEIGKYGSATRHGMYSSGMANVPQCDLSCMISPEMFDAFAIPGIVHEMDILDAVEYHLDGPAAIRHLERLARIPKLRVVQWVAGAGEAESMDWTYLYKRILALGKGLILGGDAERVVEMQRKFKSKDIFYSVGGLKTRAQAEDFLAGMYKTWGDSI